MVSFERIDALERAHNTNGLVAVLQEPTTSPRMRENVVWALKRLGDRAAVPGLVEAGLREGNPSARLAFVEALRSMNDAAAVPFFIQALDDPKQNTRLRAIWGLEGTAQPAAVHPLIDLLKDRDPAIRVGAARALARLGDPAAIRPLDECIARTRRPLLRARLKAARTRLQARGDFRGR